MSLAVKVKIWSLLGPIKELLIYSNNSHVGSIADFRQVTAPGWSSVFLSLNLNSVLR